MTRKRLFLLTIGVVSIILTWVLIRPNDAISDEETASAISHYDTFLTQQTIPPKQEIFTPDACLIDLWNRESGWEEGRLNISSFACGIPQALPCTKIYPDFANMKQEWRDGKLYLTEPDRAFEIQWGLIYIQERYGNSCTALEHQILRGWY